MCATGCKYACWWQMTNDLIDLWCLVVSGTPHTSNFSYQSYHCVGYCTHCTVCSGALFEVCTYSLPEFLRIFSGFCQLAEAYSHVFLKKCPNELAYATARPFVATLLSLAKPTTCNEDSCSVLSASLIDMRTWTLNSTWKLWTCKKSKSSDETLMDE